MVGDGDIDIEAGKRAGVVTCGVTYGLGRKEDVIGAKPDFIIASFSELTDYIC
jgi:phosphoglycolate phosphatase-like HAD superfamily hydrolase